MNRFLRVVCCGLVVGTIAGAARAQSAAIGLSFTSSAHGVDSSFIPPDTMGAVGNAHIVEILNGSFKVYDKSSGATLLAQSLNDFWNDSGSGFDGDFAFDPRVVYDPFAQRYYATAVDNKFANNNFLVAVSQTDNPLDGWSGFKIDSDAADLRWADFPQIGFNQDAVVIAAKMQAQAGVSASASSAVVSVAKADLLAPAPAPTFSLINGNLLSTIRQTQPVVDLDNTPGPLPTFSATISLSTLDNVIQVATVLDPATPAPSQGPLVEIPVTAYTQPPDGNQPPGFAPLHSRDDRIGSSVIHQDGSFWGVHTVKDPVTGNAATQWFEIDAATRSLLQDGFITDPELDLLYPSIAVNEAGDVVIGFSGTGPNTFAGAYAIVGQTDPLGSTTFGDIMLLQAGQAGYERIDSNGRNRWGDYSSTVVDPQDPNRFWTFQEFVLSEDQWAIQITELIVPEPAGVALPLLMALFIKRRR